ncbi:hypothetical protein B0H11DRAFT_2306491 [Mycena galericulata]|nr:hypothetical protein B0H11DRAFT_2306491 [Mycena galericulata]
MGNITWHVRVGRRRGFLKAREYLSLFWRVIDASQYIEAFSPLARPRPRALEDSDREIWGALCPNTTAHARPYDRKSREEGEICLAAQGGLHSSARVSSDHIDFRPEHIAYPFSTTPSLYASPYAYRAPSRGNRGVGEGRSLVQRPRLFQTPAYGVSFQLYGALQPPRLEPMHIEPDREGEEGRVEADVGDGRLIQRPRLLQTHIAQPTSTPILSRLDLAMQHPSSLLQLAPDFSSYAYRAGSWRIERFDLAIQDASYLVYSYPPLFAWHTHPVFRQTLTLKPLPTLRHSSTTAPGLQGRTLKLGVDARLQPPYAPSPSPPSTLYAMQRETEMWLGVEMAMAMEMKMDEDGRWTDREERRGDVSLGIRGIWLASGDPPQYILKSYCGMHSGYLACGAAVVQTRFASILYASLDTAPPTDLAPDADRALSSRVGGGGGGGGEDECCVLKGFGWAGWKGDCNLLRSATNVPNRAPDICAGPPPSIQVPSAVDTEARARAGMMPSLSPPSGTLRDLVDKWRIAPESFHFFLAARVERHKLSSNPAHARFLVHRVLLRPGTRPSLQDAGLKRGRRTKGALVSVQDFSPLGFPTGIDAINSRGRRAPALSLAPRRVALPPPPPRRFSITHPPVPLPVSRSHPICRQGLVCHPFSLPLKTIRLQRIPGPCDGHILFVTPLIYEYAALVLRRRANFFIPADDMGRWRSDDGMCLVFPDPWDLHEDKRIPWLPDTRWVSPSPLHP